MTLRLNLGCGHQAPAGWVNIDRECPPEYYEVQWTGPAMVSSPPPRYPDAAEIPMVVRHDLTTGLPMFADGAVDYAVCHHMLDLLELAAVMDLLREVHRVLKPGGVLRCSGADLARGVQAAIAADYDFFAEKIRVDESRRVDHVWLEATVGFFITQGGARKHWLSGITTLAEAVGFAGATNVEWFNGDRKTMGPDEILELDSRQGESWFAEAWK